MNDNKVTIEQVLANMHDMQVQTIREFDKPVTHVAVRMLNGFVLHEESVCVDPENYDENIGKDICLRRIEEKVWFLLGYALQEKKNQCQDPMRKTAYQMFDPDYNERFKAEVIQTKVRFERLSLFLHQWDRGELDFEPKCPRELLDEQYANMANILRIYKERAAIEGVELGF